MTAPKNQLFYQIEQYTHKGDSQYVHLYIRVFEADYAGRYQEPDQPYRLASNYESLEINWQAETLTGQEDEKAYWYALTIKPNISSLGSVVEAAARFNNLTRRIFHKLEKANWYTWQPAEVVAKLHKMGAKRVHYDARLHDLFLLSDLPPVEFYRWMDDTDRYQAGISNITCSVLAITEEDARQAITSQWLTFQGHTYDPYHFAEVYPSKGEQYHRWVAAGRPVRTSSYETPQAPLPLETVLSIPTRKSRWG